MIALKNSQFEVLEFYAETNRFLLETKRYTTMTQRGSTASFELDPKNLVLPRAFFATTTICLGKVEPDFLLECHGKNITLLYEKNPSSLMLTFQVEIIFKRHS